MDHVSMLRTEPGLPTSSYATHATRAVSPAASPDLNELGRPVDPLQRVAFVAAGLLGAPAAAVTLVPRESAAPRVAASGIADVMADPLIARTICLRVAQLGSPVVVEDAADDALVLPLVAGRPTPIRAYAGVPVKLDGMVVGALCVFDLRRRPWTDGELATLREVAALAEAVVAGDSVRSMLHDPVTHLPRRGLFDAHLHALRAANRRSGRRVALAAISIAEFPLLSDALGGDAGNRVLVEIARRMVELPLASEQDPIVCRVGTDTFLLAVAADERDDVAASVASALSLALTDRPLVLGGEARQVQANVVAVLDDDPSVGEETLIRRACFALQRAQGDAPSPSRGGNALRQLTIKEQLRGVEQRGELRLFYQPIVDLESGQWRGFEALLRWKNERLGPVSPADFIPTAEQTGAIIPIGQWVLEQAIRQIGDWREFRPELDLRVAVNMACQQLAEPRLAEQIAGTLEAYGVPAASLVLEIPGSGLSGQSPTIDANLAQLRRIGVHVSVDDFGGGLVGLGRGGGALADELKLDRSFVSSLDGDEADPLPVSAIMAMAARLGLPVVATGIETAAQRAALVTLGCQHGQGYFLARPAPSEAIAAALSSVFTRDVA